MCCVFRSDTDSALTALEHCVKHYNKAPSYSSILKLLIEAEDADRLQKGNDTCYMSVYSQMSFLAQLAKLFTQFWSKY